MKTMKILAGAAFASCLLAAPALAVTANTVTFAQYTQQSSAKIAQYGASDSGNTLTIASSPAFFVITDFGPTGFYPTVMSMQAASSALITNLGPQFEQVGWSGSMTFGDGGSFLTVAFNNAVMSIDGNGGSASLISTDPVHFIDYSSDVLTLPALALKNLSLAFTGLTPSFTVAQNGYGTAFAANTAGSFAGSSSVTDSAVPEPASWAMLLVGFGAVGGVARRRSRQVTVAA